MTTLKTPQFSAARAKFLEESLSNFEKPLVVLGLGRFGGNLSLIRFLCQLGHRVEVLESSDQKSLLKSYRELAPFYHLLSFQWENIKPKLPKDRLSFISPAVPPHHPLHQEVSPQWISSEIEVSLWQLWKKKTLVHAVTGSVAKSTCGSLMSLALNTIVYGNIGKSALDDLTQLNSEIVLELSSFQLHYLKLSSWGPSSYFLGPLDNHHQDWHGGIFEYQRSKLDWIESWAQKKVPGSSMLNSENFLRKFEKKLTLKSGQQIDLKNNWNLPGLHNLNNLLAVLNHLDDLGRFQEKSLQKVLSFKGLPHRLEKLLQVGHCRIIDDSKSTTPSATLQALECVNTQSILLLQGVDRGQNFHEVFKKAQEKQIKVICIGDLARDIKNEPERYPTLSDFFEHLKKLPEGDLLLSPGAPSYDQYQNYEERGRDYSRLAKSWLKKLSKNPQSQGGV